MNVLLILGVLSTSVSAAEPERPNIIFLLADDLGYGDVGCFGQKKIKTPNIDRLAEQGMKLTRHYAGSNVCAPSRCALMTGLHSGHGFVRENRQAKGFPEGQTPVPPNTLQFPLQLKSLGYTVGGFGKWGLGPMGSTGDPLRQGFERWYGFNCQAVAHNYYPTHLWDDDKQIALQNPKFSAHQKFPADADPNDPKSYARYQGKDYAPDLISAKAREFLTANKNRPFMLYYPTTVPHLALQAPDDGVAQYAGKFPEEPYLGGRGYLPQRQPHAAYAAMVSRMDAEIGRLLDLVHQFGLDEKTIVVFTSDNGPLYDELGGTDTDFFNSSAGLRGRKGDFYEGGFREPCVVRWTGRIKPGSESDRITGFEDWFPTLFELIGAADHIPKGIDGISFAPTLLGKSQEPRPFLYRESPGYGGQQCVLAGEWKAIRRNLNPGPKAAKKNPAPLELYRLSTDPAEKTNVAKDHPDVVERLSKIMTEQHVPSKEFPVRALDGSVSKSSDPKYETPR